MSEKFIQWGFNNALSRIDGLVVAGKLGKSVMLTDQQISGGTASPADAITYLPAYYSEKTTVNTAADATDLTLIVDGDAADGKINGYTPLTSDYLMVATDTGWQLLTIGGVSLAAGKATLTVAGLSGITGLQADTRVGATAVIAKGVNAKTIAIGATVHNHSTLPRIVGGVDCPMGILYNSQAAAAHSAFGIGEWID